MKKITPGRYRVPNLGKLKKLKNQKLKNGITAYARIFVFRKIMTESLKNKYRKAKKKPQNI